MKKVIKYFVSKLGYEISKKQKIVNAPAISVNTADAYDGFSDETKLLYDECKPYTMVTIERINAVVGAIDYICKNNIEGDIVECGVWKGGAMYVAAKALVNRKVFNKKFFLFDTYDVDTFGKTTNESEFDKDYSGKTASDSINDKTFIKENYNYHLVEVKKLLESTGYPKENFIYVIGRVENTIPTKEIKTISLLRLDTDWYESTKHELIHLYPFLADKGVLLIDDYGFWQGCRQAVDEYINENRLTVLLHRTDRDGRSVIKVH
jgi:O-methyltransferase